MKELLKTTVAVLSAFTVMFSFSSCTLFKTLRENALNAEKKVICATPDDSKIIDEFNSLVEISAKKASEIKENISYSAGTPDITKNGEKAGLLAAGAKQLKNLIMDGKPGKKSRVLENGTGETLLNEINASDVLDFSCDRNISSENVTDAKGHEVEDKNGNVETTRYIGDNTAHFAINFFKVLNADGSPYDKEDKKDNENEEETTVIYADDSVIEGVFGAQQDKQAVLQKFECIADYLKIEDYKINYGKCSVSSDSDLETDTASFVKFTKEMTVTAVGTGVGALSKYGEIDITFPLTKTTVYEFNYTEPAEE